MKKAVLAGGILFVTLPLLAQTPPASQPEQQGQPAQQQAELQALLAQEADLASRYTDSWPELISVRKKIKDTQDNQLRVRGGAPKAEQK